MKRFSLFSLFFVLVNIVVSAQITSYSSYDNISDVVYDVEDMEAFEIKDYNSFIKDSISHDFSLGMINASRAQDNLINSPATIIEFQWCSDMMYFNILNTTVKTIKEITLEFEFKNGSNTVYDVNTGDRYMIIKFTNLRGRTSSNLYWKISEEIFKCYHALTLNDASFIKPFHNKKANFIKLHKASIRYTDGTVSNKIAVFDAGYFDDKSLFRDGPLAPISKYVDHMYQLKQDKTHIVKEGQTLTHIASIYNVSKDAIMKANNLTNEHIFIGQTLKIPTSETVAIPPKQSEPNYPIDKPEVSGLDGYTLAYSPKDKSLVEGTVVVRVVVSPTGSVTSASVVGGSITDEATRTICRGLAQQTTFRVSMGQVIERTGTLTYTIKEGLTPSTKTEKDEVFTSAAHMPSFPGGSGAMMKYIWSHLRYPESAAANNVNGKVIVQFVVEKDGSVGEVKVARSVDKELEAEAMRVCKSLPKFSPGRNAEGDPVRVWYTLPITFKLQGSN